MAAVFAPLVSMVIFCGTSWRLVARSKNRQAQPNLESAIQVTSLTHAAGQHYGLIRLALGRAAQPIGNNDLWLAAHALAEGWTLVTNNTREFTRVPGLRIENWVE